MDRALVFTRTKHGADKVVKHLAEDGIPAAAIHGNKSQAQREKALAAFKNGETRILVATDIAARGIDVDAVSHVVNFDLPNVPESYVHRIGRTARAGAEGRAISLCDGEERAYLKSIEKLTRQTIPSEDRRDPSAPRPAASAEARPPAWCAGPASGSGWRCASRWRWTWWRPQAGGPPGPQRRPAASRRQWGSLVRSRTAATTERRGPANSPARPRAASRLAEVYRRSL